MKILILCVLLLAPACGSLPVTEALMNEQIQGVIARTDARVAAGEEFNAAVRSEFEALKSDIAADAESILPGLLGEQLPIGGGLAAAVALWLLRNRTRQKLGLPATLLAGTKAPDA